MAKEKRVVLKCGVAAEYWTARKKEWLRISIGDLFKGYGNLNNLLLISELFKELNSEGYEGEGMSLVNGYYGSIDDLLLDVCRDVKKSRNEN